MGDNIPDKTGTSSTQEEAATLLPVGAPAATVAVLPAGDAEGGAAGAPTPRRTVRDRVSAVPLGGQACVLLSCLLQSVTAVIVKALGRVDPFLVMSLRGLVIVGLAGPLALWSHRRSCRRDEKGGERLRTAGFLLARSLCMSACVCFAYYAIRNMPLGDFRMIAASSPVFVAVFARLCLKELCSLFKFFTLLLTLVGVVIVMRPPAVFDLATGDDNADSAEEEAAHFHVGVLALVSTAFQALGVIVTKALAETDTFLISFCGSMVGVPFGLAASALFGDLKAPAASDAGLMCVAGLFSFLGQCFMILALKVDDAGTITLARKSEDILLAVLAQVLYFGEVPDGLTVLGALLIFACIVLAGGRKLAESSAAEGSVWRRLFCLNEQSDPKDAASAA